MHFLAVTACQRAVIDAEGHGDGGWVNRLGVQWLFHGQCADRIGHGGLGHAGDRDDVTSLGFVDILLGKTAERLNSGDAELFDLLADAAQGLHGGADFQRAAFDTAGQQAPDKRVAAQCGGQHAEVFILVLQLLGFRHMVDDQIKQCVQVLAGAIQLVIGPAGAAGGIHVREVQLVIVGIQRRKQVETFVQCAIRLGIGFVDLVQHHDRAQPQGQRLGGDEFGLRHRAFRGVDQQHHAIDHRQDPLYLATEIGVAGGVDDIDAGAFPFHRGGLGEDGNAALAFQVIAVHGPFGHGLVLAERAGLFQKLIHQRCFAVVNVSDDRNVAKVHGVYLNQGGLAQAIRRDG